MRKRCHVATRKGLFTLEHSGGKWSVARVHFLGDNCTLAAHDPRTGDLLATLNHGHFGVKMHRSQDAGVTWQETASPKYPPKPEGYIPRVPVEGNAAEWSLKLVWALTPAGVDQPGVIWCGTLPGGLFRSPDGGTSWELNRPLWDHPRREEWFGGGMDIAGIHSVCVDPRDSRRVTIGVSCGGVWNTPDGGATWELTGPGMRAEFMPPEKMLDPNVQDPHLLAQCPSDPDVVWTQHHNGIFVSRDGARTWKEIENVQPSAFGFAVAVHPHDADTAWFVPAVKDEKRYPADGKVVVNRTKDGGRSFQTLTRGLPQEHAYDLVYRHALDVDETGDALIFGSTTGSLWASEDGGDSWTSVSTNLPPIHAVRFEK
jgi:hypothetical protein